MGGIKKPSGKKLPSGYARVIFFQPNVECFTISEGGASKPAIMFRAITGPSYKVLIAFAAPTGVDDFLDEIFFKSVGSNNRLWLCEFTTGE